VCTRFDRTVFGSRGLLLLKRKPPLFPTYLRTERSFSNAHKRSRACVYVTFTSSIFLRDNNTPVIYVVYGFVVSKVRAIEFFFANIFFKFDLSCARCTHTHTHARIFSRKRLKNRIRRCVINTSKFVDTAACRRSYTVRHYRLVNGFPWRSNVVANFVFRTER